MEKKYQEVELKFKLGNYLEVINMLNAIGARIVGEEEYQKDTYYMPSHRDFFEEEIVSEWIRLRETKTESQLNYKRWLPIGAKIQTHCEEYETNITDIYALKKIFEYMDFKEIIVVEKKRTNWNYRDYLISIDEVTDLGCFIEIEYASSIKEEEINSVLKEMEFFLKEELHANISERDRRGYPYQMMELKGLI